MTPDFFDEKPKTGLGFEMVQPQQKYQCRPTLQFMANQAVQIMQPTRIYLPLVYDVHSSLEN